MNGKMGAGREMARGTAQNYYKVKEKVAKARGDDIPVHFKHAREIAHTIKLMHVKRAKSFLVHVTQKKEAVPYRRFKGGIGRHPQGKVWKWAQCGWPVKAAKVFLDLIRNAEGNARKNQLKTKLCVISHIKVNRAAISHRRMYRAHGRINHFNKSPCHIELILTEDKKQVPKAKEVPKKETALVK
ncbi:MAG: putative 60S ribosomal protein L17 [Streblomastix strix]|uniref:Putative 60S ribosomal protein L17 n=1 Tax=Streblomastix strix TaxID=222440 RepID=A0A5J4W206_9EUKA|nr:MAG: putative 60S ribosomal protein L17 [Streblomastix strix]